MAVSYTHLDVYKRQVRAEYVGIAILLLLMIVANLNDVLRWLGIITY